MIAAWPDADDVERYAATYGLDEADIVRDIVRIVSIAHLRTSSFLNEDCVLTGGMGFRLRGSSRFTIKDTDSSLRGPLDELELAGSLNVSVGDELDIRVDPGERWGRATPKLTIAKPVDYDAYFAGAAGDPVSGSFTFTVNQRGLFRPATWLMLVHPYRELVLAEDVRVPVMNLEEQAAEKIVVGLQAASSSTSSISRGSVASTMQRSTRSCPDASFRRSSTSATRPTPPPMPPCARSRISSSRSRALASGVDRSTGTATTAHRQSASWGTRSASTKPRHWCAASWCLSCSTAPDRSGP